MTTAHDLWSTITPAQRARAIDAVTALTEAVLQRATREQLSWTGDIRMLGELINKSLTPAVVANMPRPGRLAAMGRLFISVDNPLVPLAALTMSRRFDLTEVLAAYVWAGHPDAPDHIPPVEELIADMRYAASVHATPHNN